MIAGAGVAGLASALILGRGSIACHVERDAHRHRVRRASWLTTGGGGAARTFHRPPLPSPAGTRAARGVASGRVLGQHRTSRAAPRDADDGCALLVFQTPDLPAPLAGCRPGWTGSALLATSLRPARRAQDHRRFIKTHTPLDGIPLDRAGNLHRRRPPPAGLAVSLYHQGDNLDRELPAADRSAGAGEDQPAPRPDYLTGCGGGSVIAADPRERDGLAGRRDVAPLRRVGASGPGQRRARALRRPVDRPGKAMPTFGRYGTA